MKHDLHYLVNTNQSTQEDTLPATVASYISVSDILRTNLEARFILVNKCLVALM